jgi:hypothetical protein
MPSDDVDRATLAEVIEGVLDQNRPSMPAHDRRQRVHEGSVLLIQKARQLPTAPERLHWQANLQDATDRAEVADREALELPGLCKRHQLLGNSSPIRNVLLTPPQPAPNRSQGEANPEIVHRAIVRVSAHPRLTVGLRSADESPPRGC